MKRKGNSHGKKNKTQMWNLDVLAFSLHGVGIDRLHAP